VPARAGSYLSGSPCSIELKRNVTTSPGTTSTIFLEAHPIPIEATGDHAMHTAHLIVCGVLTPGRATIFQRIMSCRITALAMRLTASSLCSSLHGPLRPRTLSLLSQLARACSRRLHTLNLANLATRLSVSPYTCRVPLSIHTLSGGDPSIGWHWSNALGTACSHGRSWVQQPSPITTAPMPTRQLISVAPLFRLTAG
jgi:hypothetical protein